MIPKADGGERSLGIPTIRDRVAQTAAKLVLEPIYEAGFKPNAYGYRPTRGALLDSPRTTASTDSTSSHAKTMWLRRCRLLVPASSMRKQSLHGSDLEASPDRKPKIAV